MFTMFMMILSSLVTLYFARPTFRKRVNNFFDWSDNKEPPLLDDEVDFDTIDVLGSQPYNKHSSAWMEWTEEDEENKNDNVPH